MIKLVSALAFFTVALCAPQFPYSQYQPYNAYKQYTPTPQYYPAVTTAVPVLARTYHATAEAQAPILRQVQDAGEDGSYQYAYETGNGIAVQEQGGLKAVGNEAGTVAQGSYSYTSPEGQVISISYVADENGFHAVGDAIPTSPPVPPAIQRALAYIAAHPQPVETVYAQKRYY